MGKRSGIREAIPEAIWVEILARLPLRSIARSKSVCKRWKSAIETCYFRRLFVSLHRNSSSSWSLVFGTVSPNPITEAIGFHGCKKWDLPKTPSSHIMPFQPYPNLPATKFRYVTSSNGLILIGAIVEHSESLGDLRKFFVGNPVLQQWVEIPPLPNPKPVCDYCSVRVFGLVTRVEEDGLVSSFKVLTACEMFGPRDERVYVYSSETGLWTFKRLRFLNNAGLAPAENHSGVLYTYVPDPNEFGRVVPMVVAHDFYGPEDDDQWRVIPLPLPYNRRARRCLTASRGHVIYMEVLDRMLKVWKLKDNNSGGECWHLSREAINMASVGFDVDCFPLGANPFDSDIVYLWSQQHGCLVSGNLQKQEFVAYQESEISTTCEDSCVVNTLDSKGSMEGCKDYSVLVLSQFVLPQWMDPVPRPPN